jgi:hypothetical protein
MSLGGGWPRPHQPPNPDEGGGWPRPRGQVAHSSNPRRRDVSLGCAPFIAFVAMSGSWPEVPAELTFKPRRRVAATSGQMTQLRVPPVPGVPTDRFTSVGWRSLASGDRGRRQAPATHTARITASGTSAGASPKPSKPHRRRSAAYVNLLGCRSTPRSTTRNRTTTSDAPNIANSPFHVVILRPPAPNVVKGKGTKDLRLAGGPGPSDLSETI